MATMQQLEQALRMADAAGNVEDARAIASEIMRMRQSEPRSVITKTEQGKVFRDGQVVYDPATDPTNVTDPTQDMSQYQRFMAGVGGKMNRAGLALKDIFVGADEELAAARERDKALYGTRAGALGGFATDVTTALPFVGGAGLLAKAAGMAPKAAAYAAPALGGAAEFAALQGTTEDQNRLSQAATGASMGLLGKFVGEKVSQMARSSLGRAQDAAVKAVEDSGYQIPSAVGDKSSVGGLIQSIGGGVTETSIRKQNQIVTNKLAKQALGIDFDKPFSEGIKKMQQPYKNIVNELENNKRTLVPDEKLLPAIETIKDMYKDFVVDAKPSTVTKLGRLLGDEDAALQAKDVFELIQFADQKAKKGFKSSDVVKTKSARAYREFSNELQDFMSRKIEPRLKEKFNAARKKYAIAQNIDDALPPSGEVLDPAVLSRVVPEKTTSKELKKIVDAYGVLGGYASSASSSPGSGGIVPTLIGKMSTSRPAATMGRIYGNIPISRLGQPMGLLSGMSPAQAGILGLSFGQE